MFSNVKTDVIENIFENNNKQYGYKDVDIIKIKD